MIKVEGLGKCYRIGGRRERYGSLRESLAGAAAGAWRRTKALLSGAAPGQGTELFWALKGISFEVQEGEVLGIIGRNGAGKSTLLKVLSRITEPTEGRAVLHGRVGSLLEVGVGFHPELTGRENIYLSGAILGMRRAEINRKFDEIVAFAEIEKFLDTPAKRYSSGMYVRLGFAVAAHLEPEILLVDEVLAVGDIGFQKKCLGKMSEVAKGGRTVLFVSHNMAAVERLCDRVILLREGRIERVGNAKEAIGAYVQSQSEDVERVPVAELPRSASMGHRIRIADAWPARQDGSRTAQFVSSECPGLFAELTVLDRDYDDLHVTVGIETIQQLRVTTVTTRTEHGHFACGHGRKISVLLSLFDLNLAPGQYAFTIAAGSRGHPLDMLRGVLPFEVVEADAQPVVYHPALSGVVRSRARWRTGDRRALLSQEQGDER